MKGLVSLWIKSGSLTDATLLKSLAREFCIFYSNTLAHAIVQFLLILLNTVTRLTSTQFPFCWPIFFNVIMATFRVIKEIWHSEMKQ